MGDGRSQSVADTGGKARVDERTPPKIPDQGLPLHEIDEGPDIQSE